MSISVRRKNPRFYWSGEFDGGSFDSVAQYNPYAGPVPGSAGNANVGYMSARGTAPSNVAWRDFFNGDEVGWQGGCCWTEDDFWFIHDNGDADAHNGLWRTDRWLTTQPVRIRTRLDLIAAGFPNRENSRISHMIISLEQNRVAYVINRPFTFGGDPTNRITEASIRLTGALSTARV